MPKSRRTLEDIKELKYPAELYPMIAGLAPVDAALFSFLLSSACRVSEGLLLRKSQVVIHAEPDFAIVRDLVTLKRRKGHRRIPIRPRVLLPKRGPLAPFTKLFLDYIESLPPEQDRVFPFTRQTAWNHINKETGLWNHYFRSMGENYWVDVFNDSIRTGKYLNVDPASLEPYVKLDLEAYKERMLQ